MRASSSRGLYALIAAAGGLILVFENTGIVGTALGSLTFITSGYLAKSSQVLREYGE